MVIRVLVRRERSPCVEPDVVVVVQGELSLWYLCVDWYGGGGIDWLLMMLHKAGSRDP